MVKVLDLISLPCHISIQGMVKLLCECGADKSKQDGRGLSSLQVALKTGSTDKDLLEALSCGHAPFR